MKKDTTFEIGSALILVVLALLLLNPVGFWMPDAMHMLILAATVVAFGSFAVFIFREKALDEREDSHRMFAGRAAFFLGGAILMLGIIVQTLQHALDPWMVVALLGMVTGKIAARLWSSQNR